MNHGLSADADCSVGGRTLTAFAVAAAAVGTFATAFLETLAHLFAHLGHVGFELFLGDSTVFVFIHGIEASARCRFGCRLIFGGFDAGVVEEFLKRQNAVLVGVKTVKHHGNAALTALWTLTALTSLTALWTFAAFTAFAFWRFLGEGTGGDDCGHQCCKNGGFHFFEVVVLA